MRYRSDSILRETAFKETRALFKSMGFSNRDLEGPVIGIANSWSELVSGHYNLRGLAEFVKKGIYRAGGTAAEFGVIGACDALASGHEGMKYILPSRELIACDVETMAEAHRLDALVMLGSCDKIIPGMIMAAVRLNIPAVMLTGGTMCGGIGFDGRESDCTSVTEAVGMLRAGKISEDELEILENCSAPACGSCSFYGTANSMACLAEAMGMSVTGSALIPAHYSERARAAELSGIAAVEMATKGLKSGDIVNLRSLRNAAAFAIATGASTNCFIHLSAIAYEAGIESKLMTEMYEELSEKVPCIVKVNPASPYGMEDFYKAGGVPAAMNELRGFLDRDCLSVTCRTMGENLDSYSNPYGIDRRIIRTAADPFGPSGLAIMRGNLAPESAVSKPSAMPEQMRRFRGRAKVFECEEDANAAILSGEIEAGDVVVIRYEGPKGGPGMREMYTAMKLIYGMGLIEKTALITDGRFSGTNNGCFVGHISPEAADGGPIAAVENGDFISIDMESKQLTLELSEKDIKKRLSRLKPRKHMYSRGILGLYSKFASSAAEGAVLKL
jgi:dihydroxy-acid dehydratase